MKLTQSARDSRKLDIYWLALQEIVDAGCLVVRDKDRPCGKCPSCWASKAIERAAKLDSKETK